MSLLDEILAGGFDLTPAGRDDGAIAAALSVGRKKIASRMIGIGTILDTLGPENGATFLDTLESLKAVNRPLYWAWTLLERGELDVSLTSVRGQIDALRDAGVMSAAAAEALKALAEVPEVITANEVAKALEGY